MNRFDQNFVAILNVLSLLRDKPMTFRELYETGYFKSLNQLSFALRKLKLANCIEKIKAVGVYVILGHGITLLSFYPTWKPIPSEVLDIVVPIGERKHEENSASRCRHRGHPYDYEEG